MSSDMLREVSDSLFEYLIEAFPTDHSYSRNDIEQDPMPPLLAHFLGQTLQYRLDVEIEHLRTVRSTWFDYEHPEVQHSYKNFIGALAASCHIPAEEWRSTLKRATKLVIAHLILPTHTLVEFVFRDEDGPLVAPVVYRELGYFAAYPYLKEAVETFLKKRQLKEIDRTRFSSLLTQIDRHMTSNYSVDQWLRMLRPLFDLMRRVPQTRNQGVPIDLLSMFFGDKEAYEIQGRLQVEKEVHRISTINEEALRRVIEGSVGPFEQELEATPPAAPEPSPADETVVQETAPSPTPLTPSQPPVENNGTAAAETDEKIPRPLWEQFQQSSGHTAPAKQPEKIPEGQDKTADDSVPLWMRFQKPDATSAATPKSPAPPEPAHAAPVDREPPKMAAPPEPQTYDKMETLIQHTPPPVEPTAGERDRTTVSPSDDAPGLPDENLFVPRPSKPAGSFANAFAPPPSSPYASQDTSPLFTEDLDHHVSGAGYSPLEQLERAVLGAYGPSNREMFVEHLFSGSRNDYEQLLGRLNGLAIWEEAAVVIAEDVFKRHQVNIYSPAAIMFTESIEEQYKAR